MRIGWKYFQDIRVDPISLGLLHVRIISRNRFRASFNFYVRRAYAVTWVSGSNCQFWSRLFRGCVFCYHFGSSGTWSLKNNSGDIRVENVDLISCRIDWLNSRNSFVALGDTPYLSPPRTPCAHIILVLTWSLIILYLFVFPPHLFIQLMFYQCQNFCVVDLEGEIYLVGKSLFSFILYSLSLFHQMKWVYDARKFWLSQGRLIPGLPPPIT